MTAVERLHEIIVSEKAIRIGNTKAINDIIKETNDFFKQQIKDAYNQGYREGHEDGQFTIFPAFQDVAECSNAENYYNETFNK
jgi:flagellar biosynthesis/type III secretory pathway protein FliH